MAGWEESADQPVMAPPVLRPGDVFPPRPPEAERRRGPRWPIWAAILVVLAIAGGVVGYAVTRKSTPTATDQVAAVRKAYLAWWGADRISYRTLDPSPLRPFMTDAGYKKESAVLAKQQQADEPLDIVAASHDLQVVVYSGTPFASVDDIWKSEAVPLDPTTHQPSSQPNGNMVERSTTLKKVAGRWLLDDSLTFGASAQDVSGTAISYATLPADQPSSAVRSQVVAAFTKFLSVRRSAYLKLDSSSLASVELQPYLGADVQHLSGQIAKNEPLLYAYENNYRIGMQDSSRAWIYDTVMDRSSALNPATGKPVQQVVPRVDHFQFGLTIGAQGWMVDAVGLG